MKNILAILSIAMLLCIALTPTASASDIDNSNITLAVDMESPDILADIDNSNITLAVDMESPDILVDMGTTIGTTIDETFEDTNLNLESTIGTPIGKIGNKGRTPNRKARQYKRRNGRKANASSWSFPNQPRSQKPTRCAAYN